MRRALVLVLALAVLAACGSSSGASAREEHAGRLMAEACIKYAQTMLSTDPKSGIARMTVTAASTAYLQAANTARSAAELDRRWDGAWQDLLALSTALRTQDDAGMRKALPAVRSRCDPVIAQINKSKTTAG